MKDSHRFWIALFLAIILAGSGYFYDRTVDPLTNPKWMVDRFEKILLRKEATTKRILDKAEANLNQYKDNLNFFESVGIQKLLKKKEVSLLYYIHDTLNAWSDKNMAIPDVFSHSKLKHPIVFLGNAWYKTVNRDVGSENHLIGLILIKWHYSYQNRYLKNGFQKEFHLPPCIMISSNPVMGGHVIHDQKGGFLLSLNVDENANCSMSDISVSLVLFMLAVFAFLYTLRILVRLNRAKRRINWIITGVDRKSTRLNSSHIPLSRMPSSA